MLASLFPEGVVAVEAAGALWTGPLHPEEAACIARAREKRRREFTAGRLCARQALARLGIDGFPLLPGPDRVPLWPPGVVGSISHCEGWCGAVAARRERFAGLGLDVEQAGPLAAKLVARVCTPAELERLRDVPAPEGADWPKLLFSAKESTYKCYYPLARTVLGFDEVEVVFSPEQGTFRAALVSERAPSAAGARSFRGRFRCDARLVATGVALSSGDLAA